MSLKSKSKNTKHNHLENKDGMIYYNSNKDRTSQCSNKSSNKSLNKKKNRSQLQAKKVSTKVSSKILKLINKHPKKPKSR